jgi:hypothetical protein
MLAISLPRISCTHRLLDILLIRHDANLPRATSSARSTSTPNPHKVGYVKKYLRCEFNREKGACETVKSVLTLKMRMKPSSHITIYPFPTGPLITRIIQGEMFKVRCPIRKFMDKREIVLLGTVAFVKFDFKGSK